MSIAERKYNQLIIEVSEDPDALKAAKAAKDVLIQFGDACTKEQRKIDIEDRFGSINHIKSVLNSIISNADTMTIGNVAHHRASIKLLAEGLLNYTKAKEE